MTEVARIWTTVGADIAPLKAELAERAMSPLRLGRRACLSLRQACQEDRCDFQTHKLTERLVRERIRLAAALNTGRLSSDRLVVR